MPRFEFPPSIRSRPVYGTLSPRPGRQHLMVADAEGALAIAAIATPELMADTHIIYIPKDADHADRLHRLGASTVYVGPSYAAALPRLRRVLQDATMGLQLYCAGTEGLIGQVTSEAMEAGIPHTAIQVEHRGSVARRMQCVHCKGITEDVETDPFTCAHCGLSLFVRDHYSRRLAAFQGVRVDAEDPGNVPEPKGLYE